MLSNRQSLQSSTLQLSAVCKVLLAHLFIACYVILADIALHLMNANAYAGEAGEFDLLKPAMFDSSLLSSAGGMFLLFQLIAGLVVAILLIRFSRALLKQAFIPRMLLIAGLSFIICSLLAASFSLARSDAVFAGVSAVLGQTRNPVLSCLLAQSGVFGIWTAWWLAKTESILSRA
ncbi:MAG TPA: hypothetical protein VKA68_19060 [bacterium]|nr:hypothetical protein [bacterium]